MDQPIPLGKVIWISAASPFTGMFPHFAPDTDAFRASTLLLRVIIAQGYDFVKKICEILRKNYFLIIFGCQKGDKTRTAVAGMPRGMGVTA